MQNHPCALKEVLYLVFSSRKALVKFLEIDILNSQWEDDICNFWHFALLCLWAVIMDYSQKVSHGEKQLLSWIKILSTNHQQHIHERFQQIDLRKLLTMSTKIGTPSFKNSSPIHTMRLTSGSNQVFFSSWTNNSCFLEQDQEWHGLYDLDAISGYDIISSIDGNAQQPNISQVISCDDGTPDEKLLRLKSSMDQFSSTRPLGIFVT